MKSVNAENYIIAKSQIHKYDSVTFRRYVPRHLGTQSRSRLAYPLQETLEGPLISGYHRAGDHPRRTW